MSKPGGTRPDPASSPRSRLDVDAALELLEMDLERLIETYELDVICHHCQAVHRRSIGWLRVHSTLECETCHSAIVLRTSLMNEEMRRIARQLRTLREQLAAMIQRASGFLER